MQFCSIYIVSRVLDGDDLRCWFVRQVEQIHSIGTINTFCAIYTFLLQTLRIFITIFDTVTLRDR